MTLGEDISTKVKLRSFYKNLDDGQPLTYSKAEWQDLRTLVVDAAQWTDTQLDAALLKANKYLGLKDNFKCYIK